MNELETQVAKIQIGDPRQATTYVHVVVEKIDPSETELYVLTELPMLNPAALTDCERISEAIVATLKRNYRKDGSTISFENALSLVNEELGKLTSIGKNHWISKLNGLIAIKKDNTLHIATVGKVTSLLYRDNAFAAITEPTTHPTPLKAFDNFSVGKLKIDDLLVFSTSQLFNHISIDRVRQILDENDLPDAAGIIIEILRENAGPEVACATIMALQVEAVYGKSKHDEHIDLHPYVASSETVTQYEEPERLLDSQSLSKQEKVKEIGQKVGKKTKELSKQAMKHAQGFADYVMSTLKNTPRPDLTNIINTNKAVVGVVNQQFRKATQSIHPETFNKFSRTKKFFFISATILLITIVGSIFITRRYQNNKAVKVAIKADVSEVQKLLNDANSSFIYNDKDQAKATLAQVYDKLKTFQNNNDSAVEDIRKQASELDDKLNNRTMASFTNIGTLSTANNLINLPGYFATETNRTIVSYNRSSGSVQDNSLESSESIVNSSFMRGNQAVIFNGTSLFLWDFSNGRLSEGFSDDVPAKENLAGLKVYSVNNKAYTIDKSNQQVMSFQLSDNGINKPVIAFNDPALANASDIAIDGNIYVLADGTILKYLSGAKQDFKLELPSKLGNNAKIYTELNYNNIYLLDPENKRIIILNKQGGILKTLIADEIGSSTDFAIDEKNSTIYVLSNGALLKTEF